MKKLILIDGSNIMFRAYYATAYTGNFMQNSKGLYTNAIFGFVNMMNSIVKDDFTHIMVAFDKGKKTFRHELFEDYKGGRKPMPDEFRVQIEYIKKSLDYLGIKMLERELIEADDFIGTFTTKFYDYFDEIEIITNDKDMLQLINDRTSMKSSQKGLKNYTRYTPEYLKESMGVTPDQITDLKGLMGDASDNLPGIPGVGEKTAVKLLTQYETLENVLEHKAEIKGKLGERINEHYKSAILCKEVATIKTDVEFSESIEDFEYHGPHVNDLIEFYQEMEFHSLIKRLDKVKITKKSNFEFTIIKDIYDIDKILLNNSFITLETFHSNYHTGQSLGFGFVNEMGNYFIPYDLIHSSLNLQMFLSDENIKKSVFDVKMIKVRLMNDGYDILGVDFDLLLAAYILNPNNTKEDFRVIVSNFYYDDVEYLEEVYSKGVKYHIPELAVYGEYAAKKAYAIKALKDNLVEDLKDKAQYDLFADIELPLASVLAKMEFEGILADQDYLEVLNQDLTKKIA
ncbi:MAG: 5'-3' exonuclease H3TH domain-containing protein, partial [Candidatus Izemoplasma sp.]